MRNPALREALPAVNLVALVATVAVLWWRMAHVETQVEVLTSSVVALKVAVAAYTHHPADPH